MFRTQAVSRTILPCTEPVARSSRAFLASRSGKAWVTSGSILFSARKAKNNGQIFSQRLGVLAVKCRNAVEAAAPAANSRAHKKIAEHGHLGKHSLGRHEAKSDHGAPPAQRPNARADIGPTDRVECVIDTVRFEGTS